MKTRPLLKRKQQFAGCTIVRKLSSHHDGEREVYIAVGLGKEQLVIIVYNLASTRYASDKAASGSDPTFIDEVRFLKEHSGMAGLPRYVDAGIETVGRRRLAWIMQKFMLGETLECAIKRRGRLPEADALLVLRRLLDVGAFVASFTNGGGIYNISTNNIIVAYDEEGKLAGVSLTGLSNVCRPCSGTAPFDASLLDGRFRAKETHVGIFNQRSDVYSLGMVCLTMLVGFYSIGTTAVDIGCSTTDTSPEATDNFYEQLWKAANDILSGAIRIILRKATYESPHKRFASVDKFRSFVQKLEQNEVKAQTVAEDADIGSFDLGKAVRDVLRQRESNSALLAAEKARRKAKPKKKRGFDDVAGMAGVKALLHRDFISIVRNPEMAKAYGIHPSNCTLLYGPQGCGKTFIAECAAQESGLEYKVISPSDLGSVYVHGSQQKIADLFNEAAAKAPIILIFDEFDAVAPERDSAANEHRANEVNEMLTQLNNCAERGIYVLATTNRPQLLDPAIMRKGRVDRSIYIPLPDREARNELFHIELRKRPAASDIDYDALATATEHYSCSDITFIVDEAARQQFERTIENRCPDALPITMDSLMAVIKATNPSVSDGQRKLFLDIKDKMESMHPGNGRNRVGFIKN